MGADFSGNVKNEQMKKVLSDCSYYIDKNGVRHNVDNNSHHQCTCGPQTWYKRAGIHLTFWNGKGPERALHADVQAAGVGKNMTMVWHGTGPQANALTGKDLRPGDLACMHSKKPSSHACMWTGSDWRSDFLQHRCFPYGDEGRDGDYSVQIWRHKDLQEPGVDLFGAGFGQFAGENNGNNGNNGNGSLDWSQPLPDYNEAAAAADASRGKKLFSTGSSQSNILSQLVIGKDVSAMSDDKLMKVPPRIWQYFAPDIVLPTLSFPINPFKEEQGLWSEEDQQMMYKKLKGKADAEAKKREEEQKKENKTTEDITKEENEKNKKSTTKKTKKTGKGTVDKTENKDVKADISRGTGEQAKETHEKYTNETEIKVRKELDGTNYANEADLKRDLGRSFPIVYINDHMFSEDELEYMKIDCYGFLPTIELHVISTSKSIIKENLPKEGDTCGVFIQYTNTMIKPLRCDFIITECITKEVSEEWVQGTTSMIVYGELKIPDIYNSNIAFEYQGSSRNALIDIAQKLKLGYCFNDPEDTQDAQAWYCTPEQKGDPKQYMVDLADHLYKDASSFYSAWIDPRYNLTVVNVRDMLGTTADCDDGIDLTKMVSVINNNYFDGQRQDNDKTILTPKLFNNFLGDQAHDTYYVYGYTLVNQASETSNKMGLLQKNNFGINAAGIPASVTIEINPQLCLNWEKVEGVTASGENLDARYIVLSGPGVNKTRNDNPPENGSYTESKTKKTAASDINVQSDEDAKKAAEADKKVIVSQTEVNKVLNGEGRTITVKTNTESENAVSLNSDNLDEAELNDNTPKFNPDNILSIIDARYDWFINSKGEQDFERGSGYSGD